jgi:hypothetical protein
MWKGVINTKTKHLLLLLVVVVIGSLSCNQNTKKQEKEIYSSFLQEIVQPLWESSVWENSGNVVIKGEIEGNENRLTVFSRWNKDSLYFFFKVEDTCLRAYQTEKDHRELYLDDMVEVLIDTRNDKDSCWAEDDIVYHVNILGIKKDDRGTKECITDPTWDGNARISVQLFGTLNDTTDKDTGYLVTLALPWSELNQTPQSGLTMGVNFANGDNDGKGRQLFDWVGAWPMRSPYAYGNLILKKEEKE